MSTDLKSNLRKALPFAMPILNAIRHRISKSKVRKLLQQRGDVFVEVGAGAKKGRGPWVTIDVNSVCDIYWDLRKGIPFPDERVKTIYSSHFFEHLTFKETQHFLDECRRVLMPNGKFLICVPNARIYIEAYLKGGTLDEKTYFGYQPAFNRTTRIDYINYTAYMDGEHKYMFDEENLLFILKAKGFRNVRLRAFDASIDSQERDFESIYAEADK